MKRGRKAQRWVPGVTTADEQAHPPRTGHPPQCVTCGNLVATGIHLNCKRQDGHLLIWVAVKEK